MIDRARNSGFTLLETLIATAISAVAITAVTATIIYSAKIVQANFAQLHSGLSARSFYEHVAFNTRRAKRIVIASNGLSVQLTATNNVICSYAYQDADSNPATIENNRVIYDANTATSGGEKSIVSGITPGPGGWMFQPNTPTPLLTIQFRIGDPSNSATHLSNTITGPGTQGVDVRSRLAPRNLHLWGGA